MADFVNTIESLGEAAATKVYLEGAFTEFNDDVMRSLADHAFYYRTNLKSVNLPNVKSVGMYAFGRCTGLETVDLQNVMSIDMNAFDRCRNLTIANCPNVTSIDYGAFQECSKLATMDFYNITTIDGYVFGECASLKTFIIRGATMCTLERVDSFNGTPFASGKAGGTLLVPSALVESYKTATNWSSVLSQNTKNRFLALEDYTVDGTITGEID
jgi:hypothetical protein